MSHPVKAPPSLYKKKLIETSIPLEDINREAAREKSIRHGHPSTLHLWWARRPLAACRAVLFAQLVDDPSERSDLTEEQQEGERKRLHDLISELVKWENLQNRQLLAAAQAEIQSSCNGEPPPILDPFVGGGSIPLEAQRLGLDAYASDLNPVAVLIAKCLIEIPHKWTGRSPTFPGAAASKHSWHGMAGLVEDVRCYGKWINDEAERRIGFMYPKAKLDDGRLVPVIAWIWARTVTCPNPACAGLMPLVRSFWLGKKMGKERYIHPVLERRKVRFEIRGPGGRPRDGTVSRAGGLCLFCGASVPLAYICAEGNGSRIGAQLMTIVVEGKRQRYYLAPNAAHENAADVPCPQDIPDVDLAIDPRNLWCVRYGLTKFSHLFTFRQLTALTTFADLVREARVRILKDCADSGYADSIATYLALAVSRAADRNSIICTWDSSQKMESLRNTFSRQAIPMTWDFGEGNIFGSGSGNFAESVDWVSNALDKLPARAIGSVEQSDAREANYDGRLIVATDPPYYDNISYANLSDFFYVWLRRSLTDVYPNLMRTILTPKADEIVADEFRHGSKERAKQFFEERFEAVFERIGKGTPEGYPISFFYAYKQTEADGEGSQASTGWESLLHAMLKTGWIVTATWPMRTELGNRPRNREANALSSSIVLVCRPRPKTAGETDRRGLIAALREELPTALRTLQQGSIAPVDLEQAAIGPGMAIFSRYARVNEADGSKMSIRTALGLINRALSEILARQEGDFNPDTRWCLEWFKRYGFASGPYDTADLLSKAKNTTVRSLESAGIVTAYAGKVTLSPPITMSEDYDPARDPRISEWKICFHLARLLGVRGVRPAAQLMAAARVLLDVEAVKGLAYLLYSIAEANGWSDAAYLFNSLGSSWPELEGMSMGFDHAK